MAVKNARKNHAQGQIGGCPKASPVKKQAQPTKEQAQAQGSNRKVHHFKNVPAVAQSIAIQVNTRHYQENQRVNTRISKNIKPSNQV